MASGDTKTTEKHQDTEKDETLEEGQEVTALFDQPLILEGKRKRKSVEMFAFSPKTTPTKKQEYEGGDGVQFGDIAIIQYNINKTKSDELKTLYKLCFDTTISIGRVMIKKKLRLFNGWKFDEESDDYKKRKGTLERMLNVNLQAVLDFLGLERSGTKEDMVKRILNYLSKPYDTGKVPPTPKKRRKSSSASDMKGSKKAKVDGEEGEEEEEEEEEEEDEALEDTTNGQPSQEEKKGEETVKDKEESNKMDEGEQNDKQVEEKEDKIEVPPKDDVAMETQNEDTPKEEVSSPVKDQEVTASPSLQTSDQPKEE